MSEAQVIELCAKGTDRVIAYACGTCGIVATDREAATICHGPNPCTSCGRHVDAHYRTLCSDCRMAGWADDASRRVQDAIENATLVALADYGHEWVCTDVDGNERHYLPVSDAVEQGIAWAWAVTPLGWPTLDADEIVADALTDHPEDAIYSVDTASLQEAIDAWWVAQGPCPTVIVDTSRIVDLQPRVAGEGDEQ